MRRKYAKTRMRVQAAAVQRAANEEAQREDQQPQIGIQPAYSGAAQQLPHPAGRVALGWPSRAAAGEIVHQGEKMFPCVGLALCTMRSLLMHSEV